MGLFDVVTNLFGSDKPKLRQIDIIKSQRIQDLIDESLNRAETSGTTVESDIQRYLDRFAAQTPRLEGFTEEGIQQIDKLYSPLYEQELRDLRTGEAGARRMATDEALARIMGADKAQRARMGIRGGSSYQDLMRARLMGETETQAALQNAAREREDYLRILQSRLGNLGTRQALLEPLAARELQPGQAVTAARATPIQLMAALQAMDEANRYRGLYRKRGTLERIGSAEDAFLSGASQWLDLIGKVKDTFGGGGMPTGMNALGGYGGAAGIGMGNVLGNIGF